MPARCARWDVIVIGPAHAGPQVALGAEILLLTMNPDAIAAMPCNGTIAESGKAHLVREVDALGGEMARSIDKTFTHLDALTPQPSEQVPFHLSFESVPEPASPRPHVLAHPDHAGDSRHHIQ